MEQMNDLFEKIKTSNPFFDLQKVYIDMTDEQSKEIYVNRVLFSVTGNMQYIKNIVKKYLAGYNDDFIRTNDSILEEMNSLDKNQNYIIYGAGMIGRRIAQFLREKGYALIAFCDIDEEKQKKECGGMKVIAVKDLNSSYKIIISVEKFSNEIKEYLLDSGIRKENIINCWPRIRSYMDINQYFDSEIIRFSDEEVFVDAGSYDLFTSLQLLQRCSDVKKIYAFEPDTKNFKLCEKIVSVLEEGYKISLIKAGLYSSNTVRSFASHASASCISDGGEDKVSVVCLDDVVEEAVTFIKMDIEGAELEALKGAAHIIEKYKPKIAISVYHKDEDIIKIPMYIKSIVPEYRLYLRHYANYYGTETVLYAVL